MNTVSKNLVGAPLHEENRNLRSKIEELEAKNKCLESFSYFVIHELKAPLRAINGFSGFLKQNHETHLNDEGKRTLNSISENGQKMSNLIETLLSFSKIGKNEFIKQEINMNKLVINILDTFSNEIMNKKIDCRITELPPAKGNMELMKQMYVNLISNAIKYSSKKETPMIEIGSYGLEHETIYYVKDNGAGFDVKYKSKLFKIFQRLHDEQEFEGSGIGLAFVKQIITRHGGSIWAEGEVDKGATFSFTLPL